MALDFDEKDGQTPLDPDEKSGLLPAHLVTKGDLNDWEQQNILQALRWLKRSRPQDVLSERFCRKLHQKMFDMTWEWAGIFRKSDKNIGCDWTQVSLKLAQLFGNTRWWIDNHSFPADEIAARFHRDLVWIHPYPNGNGRHARLMADTLLIGLSRSPFSWGGATIVQPGAKFVSHDLVSANEIRSRYLLALGEADRGNYKLLLEFARS